MYDAQEGEREDMKSKVNDWCCPSASVECVMRIRMKWRKRRIIHTNEWCGVFDCVWCQFPVVCVECYILDLTLKTFHFRSRSCPHSLLLKVMFSAPQRRYSKRLKPFRYISSKLIVECHPGDGQKPLHLGGKDVFLCIVNVHTCIPLSSH